MELIDKNKIQYNQLLNTGNKEHPLEWAVSRSNIEVMPIIKLQHGQWIHGKCSECGCTPLRTVFRGKECIYESDFNWNYCPNCGARMDEVRE